MIFRVAFLCFVLFAASPGLCAEDVIVRTSLDPAAGAVPGQPVRLLVDVLFAGSMPRPPLVDVGEASGAQILRFETQAVTIRDQLDGADYVGQRFEFAVFARRGGQIEIPAASVTVLDKSGDPTRTLTGQGQRLDIVVPPGLDLSGPVLAATKVSATETWTPDPASASFKPGGAVKRTITRRADGVPALGMADFAFAAPAGVRVYPSVPQSDDRVDRRNIEGLRTDVVTYVFEKPGAYDLPALVQPWWDLTSKAARSETLAGVHIVVPDVATGERGARGVWARTAMEAAFAVALVFLATLAYLFALPQLAASLRARRDRYKESEAAARALLRNTAGAADPLKTYQAVESWLRRLSPAVASDVRNDSAVRSAETGTRSSAIWRGGSMDTGSRPPSERASRQTGDGAPRASAAATTGSSAAQPAGAFLTISTSHSVSNHR